MSSLPVPVSPVMNTVESVGATLAIRERTVFNGLEEPTISSNIRRAVDLVSQRQVFPIELILERPDLCFSLFLFTQIEGEGDAVVTSQVKQRAAREHGNPSTILPDKLLLVRLHCPSRFQIRRRTLVLLAPFGRCQVGPAHTT